MGPDVTVITLTRKRPALVKRAIRSVQAQSAFVSIAHHVIIDECPDTRRMLEMLSLPENVLIAYVGRQDDDVTGPGRAAKLRNQAVTSASSAWIAFLDDDNEYHASHLAELLARAMETGSNAVYSYRELRNQDGTPYLDTKDPWCEDEAEAHESYRRLVSAGILTPGSCIMKDSIQTDRVRSVDTSEWLIRSELLKKIPFRERYTSKEEAMRVTEDDTLLKDLVVEGIRIETTGLATLLYYIGGYSTTFGSRSEWQPCA